MVIEKQYSKKVQKAWVFYDWANSVYPLVITTAIFPLFYKSYYPENAKVFGAVFSSIEIYSYAIALSLIIVSIMSPILSGIADYSGAKKKFMKAFNYIGGLSCIALFFFADVPIELGLFFCMTANIGYWGSLVFYNSYLPEIAPKEEHDNLSARGFSSGYIGSSILLVLCLLMDKLFSIPAQYCFVLVGLWWIGFAQITYRKLPENIHGKKPKGTKREIIMKGFQELKSVWQEFKLIRKLKRFLISFFVFSMAVQTIMTMAQFFGTDAVDWSFGMTFEHLSHLSGEALSKASKIEVDAYMETSMIISILLIQLIAIPGAYFFSWTSRKWGNVPTLVVALVIWIFICSGAYIITVPMEFFAMAGAVGFVMGGTQSLSRSTYSKFLPETEDSASYFSFYDVLEKVGMTIGIISFGFIEGAFNIRYAIMALMVFFIIGLLILLTVNSKKTA